MSILDCAGMRRILEDFRPSQIFHLASGLHSDPHQHLVETNIRGTISLFEAIAGVNAHKPTVVLGSSASIYGILKSDHLPAKETAQCEPADMYGVTKLASEYISRIAGRREAVPVIVARIFNIVGPGQDERHVCGRMAAALSTAFRRGDAAVTFGSLEATRDFIDVRDVARALMLLGIRGEPDSVYNLANGVETPIRSVLAELIELSGYRGRIAENSSDLNRGVPRSCADVSRLRALGFQPELSLTQSLRDVLLYYSYYAGIDETR
jgi:GDP-4-dehydro-6-deoxy-D-mannose reductase